MRRSFVAILTVVCMIMGLAPIQALADENGVKVGDFTVITEVENGYSYEDNVLTITEGGAYTISGTSTKDRIIVNVSSDAVITLSDLNIEHLNATPFEVNTESDVTLKLSGTNILKASMDTYPYHAAGLQKESTDGKLIITSAAGDGSTEGSLTATGSECGSGIGGVYYSGSVKYITINGGTINATGGRWAAGIGGSNATGIYITINGGNVTATGGTGGAGIGGGMQANGRYITITGGTVTANGGYQAAGIGGGYWGIGYEINISGGTVTANGGYYGAGIGGGYYVDTHNSRYSDRSNNITISNGTVTAKGGHQSAGIGGGYGGTVSEISITGGYISASHGSDAQYIGKGIYGNAPTEISITGGYFADPNSITGIYGTGEVYDVDIELGYKVVANEDISTNEAYPYLVTVSDAEEDCGDLHIGGENYEYSDNLLTILKGGDYVVTMKDGVTSTSSDKIRIEAEDDVSLTLKDVSITNSSTAPIYINALGNVTIKLSGTNAITSTAGSYAAIEKMSSGNTLTICNVDDDTPGSLRATGGAYAAGIGGGNGIAAQNITISGGTITASGGGSGIGNGASTGSSASNIKIYNASVQASSISITPTDEDGNSVYLYEIPDTTEGESIWIDGEEVICNIVHHSSSDARQYLYLPDDADYAHTDDAFYSLSYSGGTTYVDDAFTVTANSSTLTSVSDDIELIVGDEGDTAESVKDYFGKPLITAVISNAVNAAVIKSYTVTINGGSLSDEQTFTPTKTDLFDEDNKYYMAQIVGSIIEAGTYNVSVTITYMLEGNETEYTYTSEDCSVNVS